MAEDMLAWEREVVAGHRWGAVAGREDAERERRRLRDLYDAAIPLSRECEQLVDQIVSLEVCCWNLEDGILALCKAIGEKRPAPGPVGHSPTVSQERWNRIWAYYLSLREWLDRTNPNKRGYVRLLALCDPQGEVRGHVSEMLGEHDELKDLRVERLCLHLEFWLDGLPDDGTPRKVALDAAARAVEAQIERLAPGDPFEEPFLGRMRLADNGQLHPCHHKLFRRYDILVSSIGCGEWRKKMPYRGTDGFERADLVGEYLDSIASWIEGDQTGGSQAHTAPAETIQGLLGQRDATKVFLASLLVSLLRAQQAAARAWAHKAARGGAPAP